MLPQKRIEARDGEDGRGGLRVRVIGGGAAPPPAWREEADGGIEIGLRIGQGSSRPGASEVADEDPVRLGTEEAVPPVKARDMNEVGPAGPLPPSRREKRRNLKFWTLGMAVGSCVLAVVAVIAHLATRNATATAAATLDTVPEAPQDRHVEELNYLLSHTGTLFPAAMEVLDKYAAATSTAEVLPLLRNPDKIRDKLEKKWRPWRTKPIYAVGQEIGQFVDSESAWPSLVLKGQNGDFEAFEIRVVRVDGGLKIDWEASQGLGDVSVAELQAGAKADKVIVRAKISPAQFFTPEFPESAYRSYQLTDLSGYDFVWAFVPQESAEASFLQSVLSENSRFLPVDKASAITLKLTGPPAGGQKAFLITEILHKGWVSP
ncbi:hypothetical protein [Luteolibacter sp. Populi]|uniref:hypothetical protein n=1 Tax=Luteolibacter sp. Populi TaxID=3230487 RepID=UPI00346674F8